MDEAVPEPVDEDVAGHLAAVVGAQVKVAKLSQVQVQGADVDAFVGADAFDDLGCHLGFGTPVGEHVRGTQDRLRFGKPDFGPELDDQQVREEREELFDLPAYLRQVAGAVLSSDVVVGFDVRMGVRAVHEVAGHEPHLVVAADAQRRVATLVEAVGVEQAPAQVSDCHLRDVFGDCG